MCIVFGQISFINLYFIRNWEIRVYVVFFFLSSLVKSKCVKCTLSHQLAIVQNQQHFVYDWKSLIAHKIDFISPECELKSILFQNINAGELTRVAQVHATRLYSNSIRSTFIYFSFYIVQRKKISFVRTINSCIQFSLCMSVCVYVCALTFRSCFRVFRFNSQKSNDNMNNV